MTKEEAHQILDEQKNGTRLHPIVKITRALWTTGDIGRTLPAHSRPFDRNGINEWLESTRMAQSTGTGQSPDRDMERDKSGFDQQNEKFTK
jgi:hypothetical protein